MADFFGEPDEANREQCEDGGGQFEYDENSDGHGTRASRAHQEHEHRTDRKIQEHSASVETNFVAVSGKIDVMDKKFDGVEMKMKVSEKKMMTTDTKMQTSALYRGYGMLKRDEMDMNKRCRCVARRSESTALGPRAPFRCQAMTDFQKAEHELVHRKIPVAWINQGGLSQDGISSGSNSLLLVRYLCLMASRCLQRHRHRSGKPSEVRVAGTPQKRGPYPDAFGWRMSWKS